MKFYKDENNKAWAYEDNVKDEQIKNGLVSITEVEFNAIANPPLTQEQLDALRVKEIDTRLSQIDTESVRPLRAINNGTSTQYDIDKLTALDNEAETLRTERATLV